MAIDFDAAPADVYKQIEALDPDEFEALMHEPEPRQKVIESLVQHFAGQFRADKARDVDKVIHIKLWDKPGGGYDHHELVIRDGECTPSSTPKEDPDLTLKVRPEDLRRIVAGEAGPRKLAFKGRLRVVGDLGFAMKLTDYFAI